MSLNASLPTLKQLPVVPLYPMIILVQRIKILISIFIPWFLNRNHLVVWTTNFLKSRHLRQWSQ